MGEMEALMVPLRRSVAPPLAPLEVPRDLTSLTAEVEHPKIHPKARSLPPRALIVRRQPAVGLLYRCAVGLVDRTG